MFRIIVPALVLCLAAGNASAKDLNILTGAGMSMPVRRWPAISARAPATMSRW